MCLVCVHVYNKCVNLIDMSDENGLSTPPSLFKFDTDLDDMTESENNQQDAECFLQDKYLNLCEVIAICLF